MIQSRDNILVSWLGVPVVVGVLGFGYLQTSWRQMPSRLVSARIAKPGSCGHRRSNIITSIA